MENPIVLAIAIPIVISIVYFSREFHYYPCDCDPKNRWILLTSSSQIEATNRPSSDTTIASEDHPYATSFCCARVSNFVSVSSKDSTSESADSALEKGTSSA